MYDVIIIGAGVIGTSVARELSRYKLKILLLDKENDVSCGASKANSGIIHGGYDAKAGTVKSRFVRRGNRQFRRLENELHFGYEECGSLVLAFDDSQVEKLEDLYKNGLKNGVDDLKILSKEEVFEFEPNINKEVKKALYCPSAGIASPYEYAIALAENAIQNGVELKLKNEVSSIEKENDIFIIKTKDNTFEGKYVINCAGVYSDIIASLLSVDNFKITPRRGEYVLLNKDEGKRVNRVLFQTPTEKGKGILVTKTVHGNLMLGPNAQEVGDKEQVGTDLENLEYIVKTARKTLPDFDIRKTLRSFAGLRATSDRHDFIVEESSVAGFINVGGIESPGLTSSPAIAEYVVEILKEIGLATLDNEDFNPERMPLIIRKTDSFDGEIDDEDSRKNIICRCEKVTEAEIKDALHRGIKIDSLDAVKRRTRAGMGLCQGNFCGPRVAKIIAQESNIPLENVTPRGKGSSTLPKREDRLFWKKLSE